MTPTSRAPEATYPAKRVCAAARINPDTLRSWRRPSRGVLVIEKDEKGAWTRYTETDALRICVLAKLERDGIDLKFAALLVQKVVNARDPRLFDGKPLYLTVWISSRVVGKRNEKTFKTDVSRSTYPDDFYPDDPISDPSSAVVIRIDIGKIFRGALGALRGES